MTKDFRQTVRLQSKTVIRLKRRAKEDGISIAEYVRAVVERDLKKGSVADVLAELNTEITLVSAMMVRELVTHAFGRDGGKSLEDWANGRAAAILAEAFRNRGGGA